MVRHLRKFNGKYYVKTLTVTNEKQAQIHKHNYHGRGVKALIIKSGKNYQLWARKSD